MFQSRQAFFSSNCPANEKGHLSEIEVTSFPVLCAGDSFAANRSASARQMFLFLWSPHGSGFASPPFPGSYLAAVTDFTEIVSPLAVPVTLASSQASLLRLSSAT
jgi:hypothetical protein